MPVIDFERAGKSPSAQIEQRYVPPQMRDHEGVQIRPGRRDALEKARSLLDASMREHHMGEGMLRPRFLALELERAPRRALRRAEQLTFLIGESGHAVHIG